MQVVGFHRAVPSTTLDKALFTYDPYYMVSTENVNLCGKKSLTFCVFVYTVLEMFTFYALHCRTVSSMMGTITHKGSVL